MFNNIVKAMVISSLVVFGFAMRATAQETITPEKRALINELLEVMGTKKNTNEMLNTMISQMEKQSLRALEDDKTLTAEQKEELRKTVGEQVSTQLRKLFAIVEGEYEGIIIPLYDKYFTENEIKDIISFYKSPTGKKSIEITPKLMAESMEKLMPKIQQALKGTREIEKKCQIQNAK